MNRIIKIFILSILVFFCYIPIVINSNELFHKDDVKVIDGVIDVSENDFKKDDTIYLYGTAEYYNRMWIVSDSIDTDKVEKDYIALPQFIHLNDDIDKDAFTSSIKYEILNVPKGKYIIYFNDLDIAYNIFINGDLVTSNGAWDSDRHYLWSTSRNTISSYNSYDYDGSGDFTVVIEASFIRGSVFKTPPILSNVTSNSNRMAEKFGIYNLVIGVLIGMLLIYLLLFVAVKGKITTIYSLIFIVSIIIKTYLVRDTNTYVQNVFNFVSYRGINVLSDLFCVIATLAITMIVFVDFIGKELSVKKSIYLIIYYFLVICYQWLDFYSDMNFYSVFKIIFIVLLNIPLFICALISIKEDKTQNFLITLGLIYIYKVGIYYDFYERNGYAFRLDYTIYFATIFIVCLIITIKYIQRIKDLMNQVIENAKVREDLSQANASLLLSQIKPHFLYNTLNTISYLCRRDPEKAEYAVLKFASFLRTNMKSLEYKEPIMFSAELIHIKSYLDIEKIRFGDRLNMDYQLETEDFLIPPLSIQPLVENAVKHGIGKKVEGGTVTIKTYSDEENNYVVVADDGVGIKKEGIEASKESTGLRNIKKRLQLMVGATLSINSTTGVGTVAKITIPKKINK